MASCMAANQASFSVAFEMGRKQASQEWPFLADCVEKLENRAAPKISQMQRIDDFSRCNAL